MTKKIEVRPHEPRGNWLRNGNPPGDPCAAPRCRARTRNATDCLAPAIRGRRRCRLHGGHSTGPLTSQGRERSRQANIKHGYFSAEAKAERQRVRKMIEDAKLLARDLREGSLA